MSDLGDKKAKTSCLLEFCNRYEEIVMSLLLGKIELPSFLYGIDNHKHQSPLQIQAGPSAYAAARWSTYSPARPSPYPGRSGSPGRRSRSPEEAEMSGELMVAAPGASTAESSHFAFQHSCSRIQIDTDLQIALNNCDFDIDSLLVANESRGSTFNVQGSPAFQLEYKSLCSTPLYTASYLMFSCTVFKQGWKSQFYNLHWVYKVRHCSV